MNIWPTKPTKQFTMSAWKPTEGDKGVGFPGSKETGGQELGPQYIVSFR